MRYIPDNKINTEFQNYISRNVPVGHLLDIERFKIGGKESSSQDCIVSIGNPYNAMTIDSPKNQFVNVAWFAQIFEENVKLRNEKNAFITAVQDILDTKNPATYGEKFKNLAKLAKAEPYR